MIDHCCKNAFEFVHILPPIIRLLSHTSPSATHNTSARALQRTDMRAAQRLSVNMATDEIEMAEKSQINTLQVGQPARRRLSSVNVTLDAQMSAELEMVAARERGIQPSGTDLR